jgi:RNA-directed DNA polymerase
MTEESSMDLDDQADEVWLFSVQRKLYQWSRTHPEDSYRDLWNWITDIRNLRCAWRKIALNKGRRTAGVDGMTVAGIGVAMGMEVFLEQLHGVSGHPTNGSSRGISRAVSITSITTN